MSLHLYPFKQSLVMLPCIISLEEEVAFITWSHSEIPKSLVEEDPWLYIGKVSRIDITEITIIPIIVKREFLIKKV